MLTDKLVPDGEKKIRDYYLDVGVRDPETIGAARRDDDAYRPVC